MERNPLGPIRKGGIVSNRYFRYWSIKEPVFLSHDKEFFLGGPFQPLLDRLTTQLYVGMKIQVIQGPSSCGKTTLLRQISRSLPVEDWDVLYLGTVSSETPSQSLSHKLVRFLDTSSEEDLPSLPKIVDSLERLSRSKRKILLLLDIHQTTTELQELESEITRLFEVVTYHNLPLYLIVASPLNRLENTKVRSEWTGNLRPLSSEEATGYLKWCLSRAQIQSDLFSEDLTSKLYKESNGSLLKLSQLAESVLIDLSLNQSNHAINDSTSAWETHELKSEAENEPPFEATDGASLAKEVKLNDPNNTTYFNEDKYKSPNPAANMKIDQLNTEPDHDRDGLEPSITLALEILKKQSEAASHSTKSIETRDSADSNDSVENQTFKDPKTKVNQLDQQSKAFSDDTIDGLTGLDTRPVSTPKSGSEVVQNIVHLKETDLKSQTLGHIEKIEDVKKIKKGSNPVISLISLTKGV
jgi:type II secretory pathway predicted ATPase ExeA